MGVEPSTKKFYIALHREQFLFSCSCIVEPIVSICLQVIWSMDTIKEMKLNFEKAEGQALNRTVSALSYYSYHFNILPPYFELNNYERSQKKNGQLGLLIIEGRQG